MADETPRPDDDQLAARFDRLVAAADVAPPSLAELEARSADRAARQRRTQRAWSVAAAAVVLAIVATVAVALRPSGGDRDHRVANASSTTTAGPVVGAQELFTIGELPDELALLGCSGSSEDDFATISCAADDPTTALSDGTTVYRLTGQATPELRAAFDDGDAEAAARITTGTDDPATARFRTLGGRQVLDLAPGGVPSADGASHLQLLVGDDLVDVGGTNVPLAVVEQVVAGLGTTPPLSFVADALGALPAGSRVVVQGDRPRWLGTASLDTADRSPFGDRTQGVEVAVPGAAGLLTIESTVGVDADALLDAMVRAQGDADGLTDEQIAGRRTLILGPTGSLPDTAVLPAPRFGPQAIVRMSDGEIVRIEGPAGSIDQVRAVAAALR